MKRFWLFLAGITLLVSSFAAQQVPSGTIDVNPSSNLVYGGTAVFDVTTDGLPSNKFFIGVDCAQNGEFIWGRNSQITLSTSIVLGTTFNSQWTSGAADCVATLWYWQRGGVNSVIVVDSIEFHVDP